MTVISTGTLAGHEARGQIAIVETGSSGDSDTGNGAQVQLTDLWVAPGAPDVRLYISPRTDGKVDDDATDLGKIADGQTELTRDLPTTVDPAVIGSVVIHCTVYSVLFGYGVLTPVS